MQLSAGERRVLLQLHQSAGRFLTPEQLGFPNLNSLRVIVCNLREKLKDEGETWRIENGGWGSGSYRLMRDIRHDGLT
jgi:hypothetical protein